MRKRTKRIASYRTAPNPPQSQDSFFHRFGELASFIGDLREIADRADRERLSVLVDQFKDEYPEIYQDILDLVELPSAEALARLVERWPALGVIKLYPKHLTLISMIQVEIINRRQSP